MKFKISILIISIFLSQLLSAQTILEDKNFQEIYTKKENSKKLVLMIYTAKTCPQCAYMKQKVFQDINVKSFMEKYFVVLEKNIDTDELPDGFQYFGIPTMFFINNKGEQVEKFIGSSRAEPFLNNLKKIIKEKQ